MSGFYGFNVIAEQFEISYICRCESLFPTFTDRDVDPPAMSITQLFGGICCLHLILAQVNRVLNYRDYPLGSDSAYFTSEFYSVAFS